MTSYGTVVSYPSPAYTNLPIEAVYYNPSQFVISGITLGINTIVTTSVNHNYVVGQQVRLLIPSSFGSYQLNNAQSYVLAIPAANQVTLSLDSSKNVNSFINSSAATVAQILAIGDINFGFNNSSGNLNTGTYVPGSFINISPN